MKADVAVPRRYRWFILAIRVLAQMTFAVAFAGIACRFWRAYARQLSFFRGRIGLRPRMHGARCCYQ
jgi:hypothetical protein